MVFNAAKSRWRMKRGFCLANLNPDQIARYSKLPQSKKGGGAVGLGRGEL